MNDIDIKRSKAIYWASGIVSICGIIFEVLFGAVGSYILGDGVKQYTITISLFLTGMGIGASFSERITKNLTLSFVWIEFLIGIIGGFSIFILFGITAYVGNGTDALFLYSVTFLVGSLTGVELPILIRKANEIGVAINKSTARVLFSDYAGGLIGGLLFVFFLRPQFGMVKTAFLVALVNVGVAIWILYYFRHEGKSFRIHQRIGIILSVMLIGGVYFGEELAFSFEQKLYRDPIIYSENSAYQRVIITKEQGDTRLYLDGQLQFSSTDEYRYHETLVHPAMAIAKERRNILVLGGGDGLALRELQKYDEVESIKLVDLDPKIIELAKTNRDLVKLNRQAFSDDRVTVINQDAFRFLLENKSFYDVIIVDLPDPNNESLNKLYTREFYSLVRNHLYPGGAIIVQATSPVFAREVYWTINFTIEQTGLYTENLHVDIPSFGNWGFVLAKREPFSVGDIEIKVDTKFLNSKMVSAMTIFGEDEDENIINPNGNVVKLMPNTLIRPHLIERYEQAWENY
mgnify:CR=1 FL=1